MDQTPGNGKSVPEKQLAEDEEEKQAQVLQREGLEQELMDEDRSEAGEGVGDEAD